MHSYIGHVPDQQAIGGMTHQQHHYPLRQQYEQAYHEELSESPQRLHVPTPLMPKHHIYDQGRTFGSSTPHQEEHRDMPLEYQRDQQFSDQQQHYSASAAVPSGMTLAAVAAAVENLHNNQNQYAQDEQGESSGSLDEAHESLQSPPSKRLFIHPYPHSHVLQTAPTTAPACTSSEASASASAPSASSSTGTFSTHNPPTPGTAPPSKLDFVDIAACKSSAGPAESGGYTNYTIPSQSQSQPQSRSYSQSQSHTQPMVPHPNYQNPPQTAPLPTRSAEFDDASIPPTPASAHPNLHYTQPHQPHFSPALAAAAEHHAKYPGPGAPGVPAAAGHMPQLPPPDAFSYSSGFPNSPYHSKTFPAVHGGEFAGGYVHPLPPLRGLTSRTSATSPILESPHQIISPLPTHMHIGIHGHPPAYSSGIITPLTRPMNLDEEVKNIEAHSGATSFVSKLWFLLSQPQEFGEYIRWTVKGKGFILSHNSPTFGEAILSRFFRHSNIASFIRQLNLYKMQRMSQLALLEDLNDSGGRIDGELTHTGFSHPHLQRGHPETLHMIKPQSGRKRTKKEASASAALDELAPTLSPGRKTRTASTASTTSSLSR